MTRVRIMFFVVMVVIVGFLGYITTMYARGYRWDRKSFEFTPSGLLVVTSDPKGAEIYVNGVLKTATDATVNLPPGNYQVSIKKNSFLTWEKTLRIEKEIVTQVDVTLFQAAGSLTPLTFSGAASPSASTDFGKIAYGDKKGLWITETFNLPIGFNREPRQVTDGDLTGASWQFSPDGRQILLTTKSGVYLLDSGKFTPQGQRVNIAVNLEATLSDWNKKKEQTLNAQLLKLPETMQYILKAKAGSVTFSPDENRILYTASDSAQIPEKLIPQLPGSSTQQQERDIKPKVTYIYDIKEDRNFRVADENQPAYWFPSSGHVILPMKDKIVIEDYDGTNKQTVYSGSYVAPYAYPFSSTGRLIILTNLGSNGSIANLYSLSLR